MKFKAALLLVLVVVLVVVLVLATCAAALPRLVDRKEPADEDRDVQPRVTCEPMDLRAIEPRLCVTCLIAEIGPDGACYCRKVTRCHEHIKGLVY